MVATSKLEYRIGDCNEILPTLPDNVFDAVITDPPYFFSHGFMGTAWDNIESDQSAEGMELPPESGTGLATGEWHKRWAANALRVTKPGGHLLSFSSPSTSHWLGYGLELAGWEVRTAIYWVFGSGWPKGLHISKAIDKSLGKEPIKVGVRYEHQPIGGEHGGIYGAREGIVTDTKPATPEAAKWEGWNTQLKPAAEPIIMARKPLEGTIAENVLKWGVGAINIQACRIPCGVRKIGTTTGPGHESVSTYGTGINSRPTEWKEDDLGRYPANVILDEEAARLLDQQSGTVEGSGETSIKKGRSPNFGRYGIYGESGIVDGINYEDSGGASRFFYVAKASREEREMGLEKVPPVKTVWSENFGAFRADTHRKPIRNNHPSVKPIALMRYLIRLVTPKGGLVVDPFLGSGTTLIACRLEGVSGFGIEKNPEYEKFIKGRISALPPAIEGFDSKAFSASVPSSTSPVQVLQVDPAIARRVARQSTLEGF